MNKTKVAVIGAGGWGRTHARAYDQNPDTVLCSITGRSLERTRSRAQEFHTAYYTDIDEMLEKEKPEFVSICLPGTDTYETTMKVIQAGIPLFVEKPLAYKLEEAESLIREAKKRNLFFGIDFNHRFGTPSRLAKRAAESGRLGNIHYALWRFSHGWSAGLMPHPQTNLIEAQCHGFNFLETFCGPIQSVMAEMTDQGDRNGYSTIILTLKFKSGALGSLIGSFDASDAYPMAQLIEFNGTGGRILIEDSVRRYTFQEKDNPLAETWEAGFFQDEEHAFACNTDRLINETMKAFREGKQPPVHAKEGLRALRLAYCAVESFEKGIRVEVPEER